MAQVRKEVEQLYNQQAEGFINERVAAREQQLKADFELELARQLAVALSGRADAVPEIEMKEEPREVQIDTTSVKEGHPNSGQNSAFQDLNGRMGTRKHPIAFGKSLIRVPNFIQNETSNDMSQSMNENSYASGRK